MQVDRHQDRQALKQTLIYGALEEHLLTYLLTDRHIHTDIPVAIFRTLSGAK